MSEAEVYAMVDYLGDVGERLNKADPTALQQLYESLRLEMTYDDASLAVDVTIRPASRDKAGVRGRFCTLTVQPGSR